MKINNARHFVLWISVTIFIGVSGKSTAAVVDEVMQTCKLGTGIVVSRNAGGFVDKPELAAAILAANGITLQFYQRAESAVTAPPGANYSEFLLSRGIGICDPQMFSCTEDERVKLGAASARAKDLVGPPDLVRGHPNPDFELVGVAKGTTDFFRDGKNQIRCVDKTANPPSPLGLATAQDATRRTNAPQVRIRNSADDLYLAQGSDKFKTVKAAAIAYSQDDEKHKRERSVVGVIGLAMVVGDHPLFWPSDPIGYYEIVPYLGIGSDITKASQKSPAITSNNRQAGFAIDGYTDHDNTAFNWSLRPNELWDLTDQSRLFTANLLYQPIVIDELNSWQQVGPLWFQWILDAEYKHGHYISRGKRTAETSSDFDRVGGKIGTSLMQDQGKLPWTWTVSEHWFYDVQNQPRSVGEFDSTFSLKFDQLQLVGLDFTYMKGRDPDTAKPDQAWKIGLGVKY